MSLPGNEFQPEPRIEFPLVMRAATGQAGNGAADPANPVKIALTIRALVKKASRAPTDREWQIVTPRFFRNAKVATSFAPFRSMRADATTSHAKLCQQMSKLMFEGAVDFLGPMLMKPGIERNQGIARIGAASACPQSRVPLDAKFLRDARGACRIKNHPGLRFELGITSPQLL
jgi:hypothetical protein